MQARARESPIKPPIDEAEHSLGSRAALGAGVGGGGAKGVSCLPDFLTLKGRLAAENEGNPVARSLALDQRWGCIPGQQQQNEWSPTTHERSMGCW